MFRIDNCEFDSELKINLYVFTLFSFIYWVFFLEGGGSFVYLCFRRLLFYSNKKVSLVYFNN